jgi:hypothetical protein
MVLVTEILDSRYFLWEKNLKLTTALTTTYAHPVVDGAGDSVEAKERTPSYLTI